MLLLLSSLLGSRGAFFSGGIGDVMNEDQDFTFEEARKAMFELCGDEYFSMTETNYTRREGEVFYPLVCYNVSSFVGAEAVVVMGLTSWKEAIRHLRVALMEEELKQSDSVVDEGTEV
jgi:hypothetical protein